MQLVPPDHVSQEDLWIQDLFKTHPVLFHRLTFLINGYRDMVRSGIEAMDEVHLDTADMCISCEKKDWALHRYGIPILETTEDWTTVSAQLNAVYKRMDEEEKR